MPTPAPATSLPDDPALLRIDGPIATITLNRPAAFNSIDLSIAKKLEQLSAEVEASDDIRVLVIEGEGRAFCAGGDLQTIGAAAAADNIAPVVGELLQHYHAFITTLRRMPKIVLASVHGSAAGAGLSLAFVADLCIATEDARFTPAYAKLGVSPDGGGTVGVVASVGTRRALQIYLAEDSFSAAQAYEWGLVAKVVPAVELKAATRELAHRLAQNAPAGAGGDQGADPPRPCHADRAAARCRARRHHRLHAHRRVSCRGEEIHEQGEVAPTTYRSSSAKRMIQYAARLDSSHRRDTGSAFATPYPLPLPRMKSKSQPSSACRIVSLNRCA